MERRQVIEKLESILSKVTQSDNSVCYVTSNDADAIKYAIESIKIDEKYQIMYEGGVLFTVDEVINLLEAMQQDILNKPYKRFFIDDTYCAGFKKATTEVNEDIQMIINKLKED